MFKLVINIEKIVSKIINDFPFVVELSEYS